MPLIATQRAIPGSGVAANLGASANFGPIIVQGRRLSIVAAWSGTPSGTFALQTTFDNGTTWTTVPGASVEFTLNGQAQPGGSAGSAVWNWSNVPGTQVRLAWTRSSGTGQLDARASWGE